MHNARLAKSVLSPRRFVFRRTSPVIYQHKILSLINGKANMLHARSIDSFDGLMFATRLALICREKKQRAAPHSEIERKDSLIVQDHSQIVKTSRRSDPLCAVRPRFLSLEIVRVISVNDHEYDQLYPAARGLRAPCSPDSDPNYYRLHLNVVI